MRTARIILPALALTLGACDVFDPALYKASVDSGVGGDMTATTPDMTPTVPTMALADRCTGDVPTLAQSPQEFIVDTTNLSGDFTDVATCTGNEEQGNDGFFGVQMLAGQRWHFHVKSLDPTIDLALYVLPTCDERACSVGNAEDECGPGRDEHMSFVAPTAGRYMVGVDSRALGGGRFDVLAVSPVCGDGHAEHSESCDDGNTSDGDGCDAHCRAEITATNNKEVEPNDDYTGANVIEVSAATPSLTVHGRLGGRCDFDMYAIAVHAGESIAATVLDPNGNACAAGATPVQLAFMQTDGHNVGGVNKGTVAAPCATIGATDSFANKIATAGTYYVRVSPIDGLAAGFDYSLKIDLKPASP